MAKKITRGIEFELEKARNEERWSDIPKLLSDLDSSKINVPDSFRNLVECEFQIEIHFNKHKIGSSIDETLKIDLSMLLTKLKSIIKHTASNEDLQNVALEAQFLRLKIKFMFQEYEETLKIVALIEKDLPVSEGSFRRLKIAAEMFAIKGICLEQYDDAINHVVTENDIINCYDNATNSFINMLEANNRKNSLTKVQSQSNLFFEDLNAFMGLALQTAFHCFILLTVKQGNTEKAIEKLRNFLRNVDVSSNEELRKVLLQQLIDIMMKGKSEKSYVTPTIGPQSPKISAQISQSNLQLDKGLCFIPCNLTEDVLLLLLIKEAMVLQKSTTSIAPNDKEARKLTVKEGNHVYNQLVIALSRTAQYPLLVECLERAMKLAFQESHLWLQFGLALANARKFAMSALVLKQCHELRPKDPLILLHVIKLYINHLHQYDDGIEMAKIVVNMDIKSTLIGKGFVALGISLCCKASQVSTNKEKQELHVQALNAFEKALAHDAFDKEALFHLALTQSLIRKTTKALRNAYAALKLDCCYLPSLQLIPLLLSARHKYREALEACDTALLEFPDDYTLLTIKVKLEEVMIGGDHALITCKRLLVAWKSLHELEVERNPECKKRGSGLLEKIVSDKRSLKNVQLAGIGDEQDDSISIAASTRLESTLSEEAVSLSFSQLSAPVALAMQARIWLIIADVFIGVGKSIEALACVKEANLLIPHSADIMFVRGRVSEIQKNLNEARTFYENALAVNPQHSQALLRLGIIYFEMENFTMAEKCVRDAINIEPTLHTSWHHLGMVLQKKQQYEEASECFMSAVDLEATSPILPFTILTRTM
ncbi:tetratricopeptide repeat protein 7B-like [Xenia sp. Carnegie-2017]|uniref:tetratricopeptide repeat protein 7B-like n=1 Tax=Xenia sp. Carnegie-2017 TaxID=2897299 RepID=UPI001F0412F8|nr:tetratricopeptide repeat protein 7B-like [Xenia sp. Carnegie-2017]XP_046847828.1 tetratricopeptide repeat protein 7B-like [Xenia sp. Carnegie-2017]